MNITIPPVPFTPVGIAGIAGLVLAALFAYIPVFRVWYAGLAAGYKSLIMLAATLIVGAVITFLAQHGFIATTVSVTWSTYVSTMIMFIIVNQPTFMILPQTNDVVLAVLRRNQRVQAQKLFKFVSPSMTAPGTTPKDWPMSTMPSPQKEKLPDPPPYPKL